MNLPSFQRNRQRNNPPPRGGGVVRSATRPRSPGGAGIAGAAGVLVAVVAALSILALPAAGQLPESWSATWVDAAGGEVRGLQLAGLSGGRTLVVLGGPAAPDLAPADLLLVAFEPDGRIAWQRAVGTADDDAPADAVELEGGEFAVVAWRDDGDEGRLSDAASIFVIDAEGLPLRGTSWAVTGRLRATALPGGGLSVAAVARDGAVELLDLASDGSVVGATTLRHEGRLHGGLNDLVALPDGGLLVAGDASLTALAPDRTIRWSAAYSIDGTPVRVAAADLVGDELRVALIGAADPRATIVALDRLGDVLRVPGRLAIFGDRTRAAVGPDGRWALVQSGVDDVPVLALVDADAGGGTTQVLRRASTAAWPQEGRLVTGGARPGGSLLVVAAHDDDGRVLTRCVDSLEDDLLFPPPALTRTEASVTVEPLTAELRSLPLRRAASAATLECHGTSDLSFLGIAIDPETPRADQPVGLSLITDPPIDGELVRWDLDGDGRIDARGNPITATFPEGLHRLSAFVEDEAAGRSCLNQVELGVAYALRELSDVRRAAPPLRVHADGRLSFEDDARDAHAVFVGELGAWNAPTDSALTTCRRDDAVEMAPGVLSLALDLPPDSWVLVASVDGDGVGPLGPDSRGRPRESTGRWPSCAP